MTNHNFRASDITEQLVQGYALWLETNATHGHVNDKTNLTLKWGRQMQPTGPVPQDHATAFVIHPDGRKENIDIPPAQENPQVSFTPPSEGLYTVVGNYQNLSVIKRDGSCSRGTCGDATKAVHYIQNALCIVTVGHHIQGEARTDNLELEIRPHHWHHWHAGATLEIELLFQGQPLGNANVEIVIQGPRDSIQQLQTTPEGRLTLQAVDPGRYLITARHTVPGGQAGPATCDETTYTTTLALMVTKHHHHHHHHHH